MEGFNFAKASNFGKTHNIKAKKKNGVNAKAEGERVDFDFSDDFLKQFVIKIVPLHFQNKIV
ncbi:hypothetical protein VJJ50_10200 [Capnocytophaga ochracea]|uniref:hypothetical protein n=1 Tax=Capnocytophaga ochracea TaxID=1018 RepID=UPI002B4805AB|nr:hypothetical protein [Capnocytophaga ochracea]MEB3017241.1 hypothetical protein [Capnocytophaga ochracea]MEB3037390.1 hypothetical protein [Capnocytophaga ochracea]